MTDVVCGVFIEFTENEHSDKELSAGPFFTGTRADCSSWLHRNSELMEKLKEMAIGLTEYGSNQNYSCEDFDIFIEKVDENGKWRS